MPPIQGNLPFQNASQAGVIGGTPGQLSAAYNSAYSNALAMNTANYNNILKGYQDTASAQANAFSGIQRGYAKTTRAVMDQIQGVDASAQQQITDRYANQQGAALQSLVNSGLGNSTVTSSIARGLTADESKARVDLANQMAQLRAGYTSQLGQAQLGFRTNAAMANTGLAQNQLQWMNTVNAPYPDANMYAQLAQQYGMAQQMARDRGALSAPSSGGAAPGLGYAPRAAPGGGYGSTPGIGVSSGASLFNPWAGSAGNSFGAGVNGSGFGGGYGAGYGSPIYGAAGSIANGAIDAAGSIGDYVGQGANPYGEMYGSGEAGGYLDAAGSIASGAMSGALGGLATDYFGGFGF